MWDDIWLKVLVTEDRYEPALMYTGSTVLQFFSFVSFSECWTLPKGRYKFLRAIAGWRVITLDSVKTAGFTDL